MKKWTCVLAVAFAVLLCVTAIFAAPHCNGGPGGGHHGSFQSNPYYHGNCPQHYESAPALSWSFYYSPAPAPCDHDWERWHPYDGWAVPEYGVYYGYRWAY